MKINVPETPHCLFFNADWREELVHQRVGECSGEERVSVAMFYWLILSSFTTSRFNSGVEAIFFEGCL